MSVQSTGHPAHLYRDEPIAITCTASEYTATDSVRLVDGTTNIDPFYGCAYSFGAWDPSGQSSNFPWLTELDSTSCATAGAQSPPFTLSLEGQVSEAMVGLNLNCLAYLDGSTVLSTDSLTISEIRVVPPGPPTLTISGDEPKIAEGKPFTFSCSPSTASPGAQPASQYRYEVLRSDGMAIANTNTYTPGRADRDGVTLRCTDNVHYDALKDKYPERVVKETDLLKPWFLVNNGPENITTQLNPTADNTLMCDVSGYPVDDITYSWSCDGCSSTDTSKAVVPKDSRTAGKVETISCTAILPSLAPVTITWNITWNVDAPLPTEATTVPSTTPPPPPIGLIVGICIGCIVVIAAVTGGVFVYKRQKEPSRQREASATAQADGKVTTDKTRASAPPGGTGTA